MSQQIRAADSDILAQTPMLMALSDTLRERVISRFIVERIDKRGFLFSEGDPGVAFYVVIDGWIRLFKLDAQGRRADVGLFGPGESFGEAVMFLDGRFPVNAQAAEASRVAKMEAGAMRALLSENPGLAFALLGSMSMHLHKLVTRLSHDRLYSAEQRLRLFVLGLCPGGDAPARVALPYDKGVLAGALGMAPEALSRAFAALREEGVEVDGREIAIASPDRLRNNADL